MWETFADPSQVEDAILNLAVNARDAMPSGGELVIETSNAVLDENYAAQNVEVTPGEYVAVSITDSGSGMAPEVLERVFEPFFTTKEVGRGSGLGLSMVYGFAKQSRGHVKIYSEVGHGTRVMVYLPRAAAANDDAEPAHPVRAHPVGRETVLVVEDNDAVRKVAVRILQGLGYQVREAADGPSALALLEQPGSIDLLFTDLIMPKGIERAGTLDPRPRDPSGSQSVVHVRLFGALHQGQGRDPGGRAAAEQALPLAKSCGSRSRRAGRVTYIFGKSSTGFPGT